MPNNMLDTIEVFSTCPPSGGAVRGMHGQHVAEVARWSERAGCRGILVYSDNSQVDAWLVSQVIIQNTKSLCPLVAVQPVYMHPYTVAKMITTFADLYRRRIYLNMVAGGFKNDLTALNDTTPHDRRYERLIEYTTIITRLLAGASPVSAEGEFYKVVNLKLSPPLDGSLLPGIFVSSSSEAGLAAARAIGATAIEYPKPAREYRGRSHDGALARGIRVGIICRGREEEAWEVARARFPEDRKGQFVHQLAMKVSDSVWHKQLSDMGEGGGQGPYWLVPFQNYKSMCPYLVGSYDRVAEELSGYLAVGYRTFILDVPATAEDLDHTMIAFQQALKAWKCPSYSKTG